MSYNSKTDDADYKAAVDAWKQTYNDSKANREDSDRLISALEKIDCCEKGKALAAEILANKEYIAKNLFGFSAVTDGLMISVTVVSTMSWPAVKM